MLIVEPPLAIFERHHQVLPAHLGVLDAHVAIVFTPDGKGTPKAKRVSIRRVDNEHRNGRRARNLSRCAHVLGRVRIRRSSTDGVREAHRRQLLGVDAAVAMNDRIMYLMIGSYFGNSLLDTMPLRRYRFCGPTRSENCMTDSGASTRV